jgi:hypothetical protein
MNVGIPAHDSLSGWLVEIGHDRRSALIVDVDGRPRPGQVMYAGDLSVCYAVPYLYEQKSFVPYLLIDDFGREFVGIAALNFMVHKGDAFPRADVYGRWVHSGERDAVFLKQLDMAAELEAFAYESTGSPLPLARLGAVVWVEDNLTGLNRLDEHDERFPEMLRRSVPVFAIGPSHLPQLPGALSTALNAMLGDKRSV